MEGMVTGRPSGRELFRMAYIEVKMIIIIMMTEPTYVAACYASTSQNQLVQNVMSDTAFWDRERERERGRGRTNLQL
jgi:hypothetical protein